MENNKENKEFESLMEINKLSREKHILIEALKIILKER